MSYLNCVKIYPDRGMWSPQDNSNLDSVNLSDLCLGVYDLNHMLESEKSHL